MRYNVSRVCTIVVHKAVFICLLVVLDRAESLLCVQAAAGGSAGASHCSGISGRGLWAQE